MDTKYLGVNLDARLRWKEHVKKERAELAALMADWMKLQTANLQQIYNQTLALPVILTLSVYKHFRIKYYKT